jgi:hypothetical protein
MRLVYLDDYGLAPATVSTACEKPISIKDLEFKVPCGKCLLCLKKKRSDWSLRLEHEYLDSDSAFFITLTYNDWSVPKKKQLVTSSYKDVSIKHFMYRNTLNKKHVQNYIKRLRNDHVKYVSKQLKIEKKYVKEYSKKIRYFAVGEYGSKTERPHYHILLFNYDIANLAPITAQWKNTNTGNPLGHVDIGTVTGSSINYVTKYMFKQFNRKTDIREAPFTLMSKKPIIGQNYIDTYGWFHLENEDLTTADMKGAIRRIPKAYLYRIFTKKELVYNPLKKIDEWKEVKDTERIRRISERSFENYKDKKIQEFEKTIDRNYNGQIDRFMRSIESDYARKVQQINKQETL